MVSTVWILNPNTAKNLATLPGTSIFRDESEIVSPTLTPLAGDCPHIHYHRLMLITSHRLPIQFTAANPVIIQVFTLLY